VTGKERRKVDSLKERSCPRGSWFRADSHFKKAEFLIRSFNIDLLQETNANGLRIKKLRGNMRLNVTKVINLRRIWVVAFTKNSCIIVFWLNPPTA